MAKRPNLTPSPSPKERVAKALAMALEKKLLKWGLERKAGLGTRNKKLGLKMDLMHCAPNYIVAPEKVICAFEEQLN